MPRTKSDLESPQQSAAENPESTSDSAVAAPPDAAPFPREYLLSVAQDTTASAARRDAAAKSLLPYLYPRVSPVAPVIEKDTEAQRRMKEASNSLIRKMAEFRAEFDPNFRKPTDKG